MYTANESELTITLINGATIWFKTAKDADALYGEDVYAAVLDEATRMGEDSWNALRSTLTATQGPARIIGNVKGTDNWVWKLSQRVAAGELPGWAVYTLTAYDAVEAGILPLDEVEEARRVLPSSVFDELYLAKPSESSRFFKGTPQFIDSDKIPSGARVVRAWDFAVTEPKPGKDPDWTVGVKVAQHQGITYIVDVVRMRAQSDDVLRVFAATAEADMCDQVVEEEMGAAGKMLISSLKSLLAKKNLPVSVRAAKLTGGKEARAYMAAADWNDGKVILADEDWTSDLLTEFERFPVGNSGHDDIVDAFAHAFNDLAQRTYLPGSFRIPGQG